MTIEPIAKFFLLLREAESASQAVDQFELHAENPESATAFGKLVQEQRKTSLALILYCTMFGPVLLKDLRVTETQHDPGKISDEEMARIATNYLGDMYVQMSLSGFLSRYIENVYGPKRSPTSEVIHQGIAAYVAAVPVLDKAAELFNSGFRVPPTEES